MPEKKATKRGPAASTDARLLTRHCGGEPHPCPGDERCLAYFEAMANVGLAVEYVGDVEIMIVRRLFDCWNPGRLAVALVMPERHEKLDTAVHKAVTRAGDWRDRLTEVQGVSVEWNSAALRADLLRARDTGERRVGWASHARRGMTAAKARAIRAEHAGLDASARAEFDKRERRVDVLVVELASLPWDEAGMSRLRELQDAPAWPNAECSLDEARVALEWFDFLRVSNTRRYKMTAREIAAELRMEIGRGMNGMYVEVIPKGSDASGWPADRHVQAVLSELTSKSIPPELG